MTCLKGLRPIVVFHCIDYCYCTLEPYDLFKGIKTQPYP